MMQSILNRLYTHNRNCINMTITQIIKPVLAVGFLGIHSDAFTVTSPAVHHQTRKNPLVVASAVETTTAAPETSSTYDQLGIQEGKLALGVEPDEVLKYIGTYVIYHLSSSCALANMSHSIVPFFLIPLTL